MIAHFWQRIYSCKPNVRELGAGGREVVLEVLRSCPSSEELINPAGLKVMPQLLSRVAPRISPANRGRSLQPGDARQRHPTQEPLNNLTASKF